MSQTNALGEFLRAQRERCDPASLGLRTLGPRRTPGLRREELASLAGISVEYLIRLERGRDRRPSGPVVNALADVLGLDDHARAHLAALAAVHLDLADRDETDVVDDEVLALMEGWHEPAVVMNRFLDVLAFNTLGRLVHERLGLSVGDNLTRALFLDSRVRAAFGDVEDVMAENVANLRALAGKDPGHPRLTSLVGELSIASQTFARLWADNVVVDKTSGRKAMQIPGVGELSFIWHALLLPSAARHVVVVYRPEVGTGTAERLAALLASERSQTAD